MSPAGSMFISSSRSPSVKRRGQRHDLVPTFGVVAGVHVVDDDDAAFAIGRGRRCVDA